MLTLSESAQLNKCTDSLAFLHKEADSFEGQYKVRADFKLLEARFRAVFTSFRELKAMSLVLVEKHLPKHVGDFREVLLRAERHYDAMLSEYSSTIRSTDPYEYFKTTLAELKAYLGSIGQEDQLVSEVGPELEVLLAIAQEDFNRSFWNNYGQYVNQYNTLLAKLHRVSLLPDVKELQEVPDNQKAVMGVGSDAEQSKLREVVYASRSLLVKLGPKKDSGGNGSSALEHLELLCTRFQLVTRELRGRHDDRTPLEIEDEYDVQYLFHALLKLYFEDVRPEEWTPSYAGGAARMDFLLKTEQVVVEIKKTRKGLASRELGEQLVVDIAKYASHADCKTLVCFVYDPEARISNARGIEADLEKLGKDVVVRVLIRPTGE